MTEKLSNEKPSTGWRATQLDYGKGSKKEGQPLAARDKQLKPRLVASRRLSSIQRSNNQRAQNRRDSR